MNSILGSSNWAPSPQFTREWLVSNGIGGFACGTLAGAVTRRYHAFLCAAPRTPQERIHLVSKIEEQLEVGEQYFDLSANFWGSNVSPRGDRLIKSFALDPFPRWTYEIPTANGPAQLEKLIWMPDEMNATVVRYRWNGQTPALLRVRPFITGRDYHSSHHVNDTFDTHIERSNGDIRLRPYRGLPPIIFSAAGQFCPDGHWYLNFTWPIEIERGLDSTEDAWNPGFYLLELEPSKDVFLSAATQELHVSQLAKTLDSCIERRKNLVVGENWKTPENRLRLAADQFIVKRPDGLHTVLAGYPWFTDWGRDTMIALPGLCLSTGRFDIAASILRSFAGAMSQGMIPNRFPEANETPDYNTVDGTLWFFHAVSQYGHISGDWETVKELYPKLVESVEWHLAGTRYGIVADDDDGLLKAGDANSQLTWMDAKIGNTAFTPRSGKAVEIQALWFNALMEMAGIAKEMEDRNMAGICTEWARKVGAHFPDMFWNPNEGCLYDCIDGANRDGSVRPNQILAVSLPHRMLSSDQEGSVVAAVAADLLTPHGLRSLSPRDSRYRGIYIGDQWSRDSAYHQGTVWAWPVGPFLEAYLNVNHSNDDSKKQVRSWLLPLIAHLDEAGLGTISEIFDGDAPHAPRGCFAQAWSVSEVLRLWQKSA